MNLKVQAKHNKKYNKTTDRYRCALFVPNHLNDAISAIEIFDDIVILGTLMGNAKLCYINPQNKSNLNNTNNTMNNINYNNSLIIPQITYLLELATENISCLCFENRDLIDIAVGDFEIIHMNISTDLNSPEFIKIKNYPNENEHIKYCETCTCFMTSNNFFKIKTEYAENNDPIETKAFTFENKKLKNYEVITGEIEMTNYSVPFDFDGDRFVWVDYISKTERRLCIYYTASSKTQITIMLDKKFGHISHMKLLPDNKIFLVVNNNQCEIRTCSPSFNILMKYKHIGAEVISSAIYIEGTKITKDFSNNELQHLNNSNCNTSTNKNDLYLKLNNVDKMSVNSNMNIILNNNNSAVIKYKENELSNLAPTFRSKVNSKRGKTYDLKNIDKDELFKSDEKFSIATLDCDGNFNIFEDGIERTMFNIYEIDNIDKEYKDKEFFSIGFPYYITYNKDYYVIGTDHGAFVIEKE